MSFDHCDLDDQYIENLMKILEHPENYSEGALPFAKKKLEQIDHYLANNNPKEEIGRILYKKD